MVSKFLKLFSFTLSLCVLTFTLFASPVSAQTSTPSSNIQPQDPASSIQLPASIPPTSPIYTDLLVHNMFHTFSCLSVGSSIIGQPCLTYQFTQNAQGAIQSIPVLSSANLSGGLLGTTTGLIAGLYANPPVRTADYLASVGEGLGIVKPAHAQGVVGSGAQVLNPIIKLWQVSRNISYVIMIIIFVIIGLMVMFRQRINPQTVITAQAALPGLVIGLILITFSYFFAALISDMAFVGTNVVGYYFAAAQGKLNDPSRLDLVKQTSSESVLSVFSQFVGIINKETAADALAAVFDKFSEGVQTSLRFFAGLLAFQFTAQPGQAIPVVGQFIGPITGLLGAFATASNPTGVLGLVLSFIAMFILIYAMFRLLLRLITAFLTIIFLTISAPFQFLAAALPGRQGIATGWIVNMLANVLIFPAVLAVFYFIAFLLKNVHPDQTYPPFNISGASVVYAQDQIRIVGNAAFPLFGGLELNFINILLAFGALVALPAIPDLVARTVGRVGQAGQLLGQEISGDIRSGQGYAGQLQGRVTGAAGSIKGGLVGERTLVINPRTGEFERIIQRPGLIDLGRGIGLHGGPIRGTGSGAGR